MASEVAQQLRNLGTAPQLLTLGAVLGEFANIYVDSEKNFPHMLELFISSAIQKTLQGIQSSTAGETSCFQQNIVLKAEVQTQLLSHLSEIAEAVESLVLSVLREVFNEVRDAGIRLPRFRKLCATLCAATQQHFAQQTPAFLKLSSSHLAKFMKNLVGTPFTWKVHQLQLCVRLLGLLLFFCG